MLQNREVPGKSKYALFFLFLFLAVIPGGCPIEDFNDHEEQVEIAASGKFVGQDKGLCSLLEKYDIKFDQVHEMNIGFTHEALRQGDVDAAIGFASDGKIKELDLLALEDDKGAFQVCHPAPVTREEVLEQHPGIEGIMSEISSRLDTRSMRKLNYRVDIKETSPEEVAREWLRQEGLIKEEEEEEGEIEDPANIENNAEKREVNEVDIDDEVDVDKEKSKDAEKVVTVSSREFSEQKILGQITVLALKDAGIPVEDKTGIARREVIRSALLNGEIDMYWAYTGETWQEVHMKKDIIADAEEVFDQVSEKDRDKGVVWLDYAPSQKTYTVLMHRERAQEQGITNLSQFAEWTKEVQQKRESKQ